MTSPSLDGAFAKLRRAKEHLGLFEEEARRIEEAVVQTVAFKATYEPDGHRFLVQVAEDPPAPLRLSAIGGDLLQNLRAALDYLAYELVALATGFYWDGTQWPIISTFDAIENTKRFRGLRDRLLAAGREDLWAMIESYQFLWYEQTIPSPNGVDLHTQRLRDAILLVFNELSNQDKHRLLIEPFFNVKEFLSITPRPIRDCENPKLIDAWVFFYTLKAEAPPLFQFTVDVTGPEPEMEVDIKFTIQPVGISYLPSPATDWLVRMVQAVYAVLEDFAPFF